MCELASTVFKAQASHLLAEGLRQPASRGLSVPIPNVGPWHPSESSGRMVAQAQGGSDEKEALKQGGLEVPPTTPSQRCPSATLTQALALS